MNVTDSDLIASFFGAHLIAFYPSAVDGTPCVRVQTLEREVSYEVAPLARMVTAHKAFLADLAVESVTESGKCKSF